MGSTFGPRCPLFSTISLRSCALNRVAGQTFEVVAAFTVIILCELPEEHSFADGVQKCLAQSVRGLD